MYNLRIYYDDTDAGGIVYHSNYLKFCERARSELFFKKGLSPHRGDEFFVVKNVEADFIKSAKFSEQLQVDTKLIEKKAASIILYQEIIREEEVIFKATFRLAYLKNYKPHKIPKEVFYILED